MENWRGKRYTNWKQEVDDEEFFFLSSLFSTLPLLPAAFVCVHQRWRHTVGKKKRKKKRKKKKDAFIYPTRLCAWKVMKSSPGRGRSLLGKAHTRAEENQTFAAGNRGGLWVWISDQSGPCVCVCGCVFLFHLPSCPSLVLAFCDGRGHLFSVFPPSIFDWN